MNKVYNNILAGITFSAISIIISIIFMISLTFNHEKSFASMEIFFLIEGIACFILSVIDLKFLIVNIRKESKVIPDDLMKNIKDEIE